MVAPMLVWQVMGGVGSMSGRPYYSDDSVTLWHGDALDVMRNLPDGSVDCCVTSPPYLGLRDYGEAGQYGLEASPTEYVETMRALFAEVRRVLTDDGTLWLNIGDSYSSGQSGSRAADWRDGEFLTAGIDKSAPSRNRNGVTNADLPAKNLMGMPWRTAFALQGDGWILRNDIIWNKPNAMPESVTDRLSTRHEHLFMFSKKPKYWFDLDAIREPHAEVSLKRARPHRADPGRSAREGLPYEGVAAAQTLSLAQMNHEGGRNPGDVWTIATQSFKSAHFAVMPQALAARAIQAGCKPGGTVLDPFSGSGTTGLAAAKHGRKYVGIDLSSDYLNLSLRTRLAQTSLLDGDAS